MSERVLVLIPTNQVKNYCLGRFIKNLRSIDLTECDILFSDDGIDDEHKTVIESLGYECIKVHETSDAIREGNKISVVQCLANARNALRQEFIKRNKEGKYSHALWFDSDIEMPYDTVKQLKSNGKDIVSGIYMMRSIVEQGKEKFEQLVPVAYRYNEKELYELGVNRYGALLSIQDVFPNRLIGDTDDIIISIVGFGCLLMSSKVMQDDRWQFRVHPDRITTTEDMWFSMDVTELGYKLYLDSRVCCKHHIQTWRTLIRDKETN